MVPPPINPPLSSFEDFLHHGFTKVSTANELCDICLNPFRDNDPAVQILNISGCNHIFGHECISVWLAAHNTCPLCRAVLIQPTVSAPNPSHRRARVYAGRLVNTLSEAFNPRSTSTGDLINLQWVDVGTVDPDIDWDQERAYRRQVREQHRHRMALELEQQWRERISRVQQERVDVEVRVQEVAPREQRELGPPEVESVEAVDGSASEGIGEVLEAPRQRRHGVLRRWRRFVGRKLFGARY
ncbi:hypothetical protein DE146DRAFT_751102 [Phaeosphaeria sp. MPI-PUGE-AT-0046c]|nr:hypothetical protein DE146DRAFT_751102 [Phaeosphaeria sp. MPI-PUGE-AT-0046c]